MGTQAEVFISYRRDNPGSKDVTGGTALASQVRDFVQAHFQFRVIWDELAITTNGDIRAYMDTLATGTNVVFVLTPAFFESPFCMYELAMTAEKGDLAARTFAVLAHGMKLDRDRIMDVVEHWIDIHARFEERIAKARKKNRKAVTREMDDELAVLQKIATGASKALFHLQNKRWMQAGDDGRIDEEELYVFIKRWVKEVERRPRPSFSWRRVIAEVSLFGLFGFGLWWGSSRLDAPEPSTDSVLKQEQNISARDSLLLDSLLNDSLLRQEAFALQDSILRDSIQQLMDGLDPNQRKREQLRLDSLLESIEKRSGAQRKLDEQLLKAARDSMAAAKFKVLIRTGDSITVKDTFNFNSKTGSGNHSPEPPKVEVGPKASYTEHAFGLEIKMVYVPGGTFWMGCTPEQGSDCEDDEKPAHKVKLNGYYIGATEITQRQWRIIMDKGPSKYMRCSECPVYNVSWDQCQVFIQALNQETRKNYRLPTEAEWEYAARGGPEGKGSKYAGGNILGGVGWYGKNAGSMAQPVGRAQPNELGIYDMSGNVWEWCADSYQVSYYGSSPNYNPLSTNGSCGKCVVVRGGSWIDAPNACRVSNRNLTLPDFLNLEVGFRISRD